jgi:Kdo2-lipid IVA lauroyltransferase/acyltransferase
MSRGRFGCQMIGSKFIDSAFENQPIPAAVGFLMDQAPTSSTRAYWMDFLGQDTAVLFGTEKYARKYNTPVIYGRMDKVKRGYYITSFELICDDPHSMAHGEILEKMTRKLEADIRRKPEFWLWTHKRWKRRRDDGT